MAVSCETRTWLCIAELFHQTNENTSVNGCIGVCDLTGFGTKHLARAAIDVAKKATKVMVVRRPIISLYYYPHFEIIHFNTCKCTIFNLKTRSSVNLFSIIFELQLLESWFTISVIFSNYNYVLQNILRHPKCQIVQWFFTAREMYFIWKVRKNYLSPCDFDNMTKRILFFKQCQSNGSTNNGERGVILQMPKQIWLDDHQHCWYIDIY